MSGLKNWYNGLTGREQIIVLTAAILIALMILYFALWRPFTNSIERMEAASVRGETSINWMEQFAPVVAANRGNVVTTERGEAPLMQVATSSAQQYGLRFSSVQGNNQDEIFVTFDEADFANLVRWMDKLQNSYGVAVRTANIGQTDKAGKVKVSLTLADQV